MTIVIKGHDFGYEVRNVALLFFCGKGLEQAEQVPEEGDYILTELLEFSENVMLLTRIRVGEEVHEQGETVKRNGGDFERECERVFGILIFHILSPLTGITPEWGILTGIRPVVLLRRLVESGMTEQEASEYLCCRYLVAPRKARLLRETAAREGRIVESSRDNSFSLYIAIPFCPSRCLYCSFVSHAIEKTAQLTEPYLEKLCEELIATGEIAKELGLKLETVYIGGGTPTTLSAGQLKKLMLTVCKGFDLTAVREYTVEAGRPDTVTAEKMQVIRQYGATRVSINPQTFNEEVLRVIGRRHTAEETVKAYETARATGIACINMDLIVGLPSDSLESFRMTLDRTISLQPENITVHTLSLKRSADLAYQSAAFATQKGIAAKMMEYAETSLAQAEYYPYYLYRQRNTRDNLENIGFSREGYEGLYNVFIMDETHTILACGAGAVTKLKGGGNARIERIYNYKYPYEYIDRFEEILLRKRKVKSFYDKGVV